MMTWMAILIIVFYVLLIASITRGWFKLTTLPQISNLRAVNEISIFIPIKNEAENLPLLLSSLKEIDYPSHLFEVIFIDDESTDNSANIIADFFRQNALDWGLTYSQGGKKKAIYKGLQEASYTYVLSLDGDCNISDQLLRNYDAYLQQHSAKMIAGPVSFTSGGGFWGGFMEMEFMSLVASGAGAIGIHKPIMLNAANLLFEKELALEAYHEVYEKDIASGDDVFLMHYVIKHYGSKQVRFLKERGAIVETPAPPTIKAWLNQRLRWTSKSKHYGFSYSAVVAIIILLFNFLLFGSMHFIGFYDNGLLYFLLLLFIKTTVDFPLLLSASRFFKKTNLLKYILFLELIYPFYIVFVGVFGHFIKPKWKDV